MSKFKVEANLDGKWIPMGHLNTIEAAKATADMAGGRVDQETGIPVFAKVRVQQGALTVYQAGKP
jgi:hypothetical protein